MPSLIDLRRRIRSVQNTQQITSAMKMVSAAKLRRAQDKVLAARPYASLLKQLLASVLEHVAEDSPVLAHPLLQRRPEGRILLVLLAGEKGLCGAFNSHVLRASQKFLSDYSAAELQLEVLGRKARDYYRRRRVPVAGEWVGALNNVQFETSRQIAAKLIERFTNREIDAVYLLYNEFKTVLSQKVVLDALLPIQGMGPGDSGRAASVDYLYEQPPEKIFQTLLPKYVEVHVHQAMLESAAAEHAARMAAMDAATRNAGEVIDGLQLHLNRVRQASITTDLIEVVSGAAALE